MSDNQEGGGGRLRLKVVMRRAPGIYRIARLLWQNGRPGFGGYSAKLSVALTSRAFRFRIGRPYKYDHEWEVVAFWLRVHHLRSYGGIIV